jgi:hypothetical protein
MKSDIARDMPFLAANEDYQLVAVGKAVRGSEHAFDNSTTSDALLFIQPLLGAASRSALCQ